ncbi:MAG TPA: hypothetical protein VFX53_05180 [Pedococcus sp.]|nr:hypothetical protein [Pedococcus sp.]
MQGRKAGAEPIPRTSIAVIDLAVSRRYGLSNFTVPWIAVAAMTPTREAAARFGFRTTDTIKTHLSSLYRAMGVKSLPEAVHVAWTLGILVHPDSPRGRQLRGLPDVELQADQPENGQDGENAQENGEPAGHRSLLLSDWRNAMASNQGQNPGHGQSHGRRDDIDGVVIDVGPPEGDHQDDQRASQLGERHGLSGYRPQSRHDDSPSARNRSFLGLPTETICEQYQAGMSLDTLRATHGCGRTTIKRILEEGGVPIRTRAPRKRSLPVDEVCELYRTGTGLKALMRKYECGEWLIAEALAEGGVKKRRRGQRLDRRVQGGTIPESHLRQPRPPL